MSELHESWIRLIKPDGTKVKVNGFTGVSTLIERDGDHVLILAADADVLFKTVLELMPDAEISGIKFQNVTVIQAQS